METKHDRPQHTPAPWVVSDNTATPYGQLTVDSEQSGAVAICYTVERGENAAPRECLANARLIAAAPDLLAVVEMVNRIWSHDQTENLHPESPRAILRAALKKAKGEI